MENKKVFVTGAGGFIGSHLCERLVQLGADVTALVRYNSKGSHGFLDYSPMNVRENIKVVSGDIRDENMFRMLLKDKDVVFHLAAIPGIPYSFIYPHDVFENNALGSLNLLNASREAKPGKIILISSAETYGDSIYLPIDEKHPQFPKSPYAASKAAMENFAWGHFYSYNLPVTIVRLFNNYGPRQSARAVTPTIISQMLQSDEIMIGSVYPKRDFTFVLDTVEALIRIAGLEENGEVFNIGSNCYISIAEIINLVSRIIGKNNLKVITDETRIRPANSEVGTLRGDYTKLKERTGWQPSYSYKEGMEITIKWILDNIHTYKALTYNI